MGPVQFPQFLHNWGVGCGQLIPRAPALPNGQTVQREGFPMPLLPYKASVFAVLGSLFLSSCSKSSDSSSSPSPFPQNEVPTVALREETTSYYRDVKPILDRSCVSCHQPGAIGGLDLTEPKRVQGLRRVIADAVKSGRMPPWSAGPDCRAYQFDRSLSAEEKQLIARWSEEGGPLGNLEDGRPVESVNPKLARVDLELKSSEAYTPKSKSNDYRCFVIDWPKTGVSYITGFGIRPDQASIVHHVIAYQANPAQVKQVVDLDAASAEPGYECYGGPLPNNGRLAQIAGWAPGSEGRNVPAGTGLKIVPGSKIVVQVHYNTIQNLSVPDRSSVLLQLDEQVEKEAYILPFTNPRWAREHDMLIPAGADDVVHKFETDLGSYAALVSQGRLSAQKSLTLYDSVLHMHTRGKSTSLRLSRNEAKPECLLTIPDWDFHWQSTFTFRDAVKTRSGDKLQIECRFDNTGKRGDTVFDEVAAAPKDINWGEGTEDEMCVGFLYVTQN